jgi:hypothetical protein
MLKRMSSLVQDVILMIVVFMEAIHVLEGLFAERFQE